MCVHGTVLGEGWRRRLSYLSGNGQERKVMIVMMGRMRIKGDDRAGIVDGNRSINMSTYANVVNDVTASFVRENKVVLRR